MAGISLIASKFLLAICNFLLLGCGCTLTTGGLMLLLDPERVLLSRLLSSGVLSTLPHPLLYYVALGLSILGLLLAAVGLLGCWASCVHSYYMLTLYFLSILIILVGECAVYVIAWVWPNCIGLGMDPEELTMSLQRYYGVAGQEQFTAAIDLAQANFQCCGIESANEYDTSLWRLQALGPALAVPLTCCKLYNFKETKAYLNPRPINSTLCQALEIDRHERFRHIMPCRDHLDQWYSDNYAIFLGVGLIVVLVEFAVLLSTILTCIKICKKKRVENEVAKGSVTKNQTKTPKTPENVGLGRCHFAYNNDSYANETYALTNSFRQNYKLVERV